MLDQATICFSGSFEIFATGDAHGNVVRQSVPTTPILWSDDFAPYSVIGDTKWSDTIVIAEVLIEASLQPFINVIDVV